MIPPQGCTGRAKEVFKVSESPFLRVMKNKLVEADPRYVHELEVLRAMLRQEDRQGDSAWDGRLRGHDRWQK